jgi:endogenous inhibitor of DNA gyrase (YacG/DUF329 family)
MLGAMAFSPHCPTCREPVVWEGNPDRPFCSDRCRLIDLGSWASERYRIPGEPAELPAGDRNGGERDEV